jgi:osmotically-inducible protein OsmY
LFAALPKLVVLKLYGRAIQAGQRCIELLDQLRLGSYLKSVVYKYLYVAATLQDGMYVQAREYAAAEAQCCEGVYGADDELTVDARRRSKGLVGNEVEAAQDWVREQVVLRLQASQGLDSS